MNIMSLEIITIVANFRSNQHIGTNPKPFHFHHLTIWKRKYGKCIHRQSWGYFYGSLWVTPFLLEDWSLEEGWKLMEDVKLVARKWNRSTTFCMNVFWCIGFGLCFPFQIQMGAFTLPLPPFFPTLTSCFYPRSETSPNTEPSMQNHELKKPFPCREKYIFKRSHLLWKFELTLAGCKQRGWKSLAMGSMKYLEEKKWFWCSKEDVLTWWSLCRAGTDADEWFMAQAIEQDWKKTEKPMQVVNTSNQHPSNWDGLCVILPLIRTRRKDYV